MQQPSAADGFNQLTVDWRGRGCTIACGRGAPYAADPQVVEAFRRDGAVLLESVFEDWVEPLRAGLEGNLAEPERYAFPAESTRPGAPGRFFDSYCNWPRIPEYRDYLERSCAAAMAGAFLGSSRAQLFHEHVFVKEPGTQAATPWHQDLPYYCVAGRQGLSIYVALDPIDAAVAVRYVAGSHCWPQLAYPRVFLDGAEFNRDDPSLASLPDIDADPDGYRLLSWPMQPGDAVLFDFRTVHGTTAAEVRRRRRAFASRWLGDDMTYCTRIGETSPPYRDHGMADGEPLREDWFPVLWRRD